VVVFVLLLAAGKHSDKEIGLNYLNLYNISTDWYLLFQVAIQTNDIMYQFLSSA
jgi:hypothetical protein